MQKVFNKCSIRKTVTISLVAFILLIVATGCSSQNTEAITDETVVQEEVHVVQTYEVSVAAFTHTLNVTGEAEPSESVDVTAKISGDIELLKANVGDYVESGQVLAGIDDTRYALTKEKAILSVSVAQLDYEQKKMDFERYEKLYDQNAVSQKAYETAVNAYKASEISLKAAQADLRSADINLKDTVVTAPIAGYISARNMDKGENISAGTTIFSIISLDPVVITSAVGEEVVNQVKLGMPVEIMVESLGSDMFMGSVTQISPVQNSARLYSVKIEVANDNYKIKSGMFALASIILSEDIEGLAVPKEAVMHEEGIDYVFTVEGNKSLRRQVTIGVGDDLKYQIKSGLGAGDVVVIVGQQNLIDGARIEIEE